MKVIKCLLLSRPSNLLRCRRTLARTLIEFLCTSVATVVLVTSHSSRERSILINKITDTIWPFSMSV